MTNLITIAAPDDVVDIVFGRSVQQVLKGLVLRDARHMDDTGDTLLDLLPQSHADRLGAQGLLDSDDVLVNTNAVGVDFVVIGTGTVITELDNDLIVRDAPGAIDRTTVDQTENVRDGTGLGKVLEGDTTVGSDDVNGIFAGLEPLTIREQELLGGADATLGRLSLLFDRSKRGGPRVGSVGSNVKRSSTFLGWLFLINIGRGLSWFDG